ncbi:dATP/dGTP diphosphohydrolase domain-containing protein [Pseudoroseomonas globiformis]|uniref:dATP/dGTP diphosphohydrolase domain-containing protein n=1 Tax=Teichococcus globiformis TaxID=2307229 RepID=A0ABV7G3E1_9PROT
MSASDNTASRDLAAAVMGEPGFSQMGRTFSIPLASLLAPAEQPKLEITHKDAPAPKLTGLRANAGKPRMDLVAPSIMTAIATVAEFGARKYAARNWENGMEYGKVYASLMRHLLAWWEGQENDPESGLPHLHHVAWNAQALVEYDRRLKAGTLPAEVDDRPSTSRG